jgi:hypothetical protein
MILFSTVIIFLIHHIILYLKNSLTVPKVKDMVNIPAKQYEEMYNVIQHKREAELSNQTQINEELEPDPASMKNELKNYLKKQMSSQSQPLESNTQPQIQEHPTSFSFSDINSLPVSSI